VIRGLFREDWQVTDSFGHEWHIFVVPGTERRGGTDWQAEWQIGQLVFDGFTHSGARDDRIAATLLEVYDALTNEGLSHRLHRPTADPTGLLRGIDRDIRQTLLAALRAGEIRVERVAPVPWPFVETGDVAVVDDVAPVGETTTWIGLCLVDQTGKAVGRRRYRITLPDGSIKEGVLGSDGTARVDGIGTPGTCQIDFLDFDKVDWGPQTLLPGGTVPGETGPVAPVSIWRVRMVGMIFDADKCFLLPQALDGIRSVVAMHKGHPAAKVVIVGHEGGDEVTGSVDLALGRAKILAGYLTNKSDDWIPWFGSDKSQRQRWGMREVQLMLSAVAGYDGSAAGVTDAKTTAAIKAFQTANGLTVDGKAGPDTRKALVTNYMGLEDTSLTAGVQPVAHGCTGHQDDTLTAAGLQPDDRRLEVLFFEPSISPAPSGETSDAGSPEYPAWREKLVETVDFENHGIHVQIVDTAKQPMAFATVHLDGPVQGDATADEQGFVSFWGLSAGDYTLNVTTKTGRQVPPSKLTYPTAKTIAGARALPSNGNGAGGGPDASAGGGAPPSGAGAPASAPAPSPEAAT
jgi:peptidoglycan hydrolase-like protein with peptidoglycan-binding domain